ncbi:MAG: hypothetical protein ACYC41_13730, partial [Bacillota bacterium]
MVKTPGGFAAWLPHPRFPGIEVRRLGDGPGFDGTELRIPIGGRIPDHIHEDRITWATWIAYAAMLAEGVAIRRGVGCVQRLKRAEADGPRSLLAFDRRGFGPSRLLDVAG